MIETTRRLVDEVAASHGLGFGIANAISNVVTRKVHIKKGSLRSCGLKLVEELLGIGVPVTAFYEILEYLLRPENATIWSDIQNLAEKGNDATLHAYVIEAQRLTSMQRNVRIATQPAELEGKKVLPGNAVVMMLGEAGRNPEEVQNANNFDPSRKTNDVSSFSYGQHECIAKDVALAFITGLVKLVANLKQLRPAPGQMGLVKTIRVGSEKAYLNDSWSYLGFDASTWKLHFDGHGKGNFEGEREPMNPMGLNQYYYLLQKRKEDLLN
ncbi:hypothetical protein JDV02_003487 [Purpureocillium takamizusanense]|uniref:Cytochrome P450 n=1 Tax=Purpureocillium takamizusanense TaxID=2060973 RepID=A0A9Q8QDB3_9HYPO|nr:uncharacterized protein JDV02_003487 [Purpureocillium takamizusanense]UNI17111.1 hypothetical protein JDV02_003487 [Purpureocillium takamizusanense]